jgi:hypothetical protein
MNKIDKDPAELLRVEMAEKAKQLTDKMGAKVHPILFYPSEEGVDPIKGYIKDPPRLAKIRILDKSYQVGEFSASAEMLDLCLIKEESDPRLYSEDQQYDHIYLGACYECQKLIRIATSQVKKK